MSDSNDCYRGGAGTFSSRWRVALVIALCSGLFAVARTLTNPGFPSDLDQLWYGARALVQGSNPYTAVGPGRPFSWTWPLFYPLPAILLVVPVSFLPVVVARVVFSVLAGGTLGFAVGSRWRILWPMFLSASYYMSITRNQWSPFILAACWVPGLGLLAAAKPNIGIMALMAQTRRTLTPFMISMGSLVGLSFLIRPAWLGEWLALARSAPNKEIALFQPGGFLLLGSVLLLPALAGRLLLTATVVPQTPSLYDVLPLFALCRTRLQTFVVAALSHVLFWLVIMFGPYSTFDAYYSSLARLTVLVILIPLTLVSMALRLQRLQRYAALVPPGSTAGSFGPVEGSLFAVVSISLGLQLWLVLR